MSPLFRRNYQVWLYVWEDNFAQIYSISLEGFVVLANFNSGTAGTWSKLGPYPVNITDGAINVTSAGGHANFSGIEVWTAGPPPPNQPPVVANPIVIRMLPLAWRLVMYFRPILFQILMLAQRLPIRLNWRMAVLCRAGSPLRERPEHSVVRRRLPILVR